MSAFSITSLGVSMTSAPALRNFSVFSCVRLKTQTEWPELSKFLTMPLPIIPKPMKPNLLVDGVIFLDKSVSETVVTSNSSTSFFSKIAGLSMTARAARARGIGDAYSFLMA